MGYRILKQIVEPSTYESLAKRGPNNNEFARPSIASPAIHAVILPSASIVGRGYIVDEGTHKPIYAGDGFSVFPPFVKIFTEDEPGEFFVRMRSLLEGYHELEKVQMDTCYTFVHWCAVYGHFLTEMLSKLLVIKELYRRGRVFPIAIPYSVRPWFMAHVHQIFPEAVIQRYDDTKQRISARQVIAISGDQFHPWLTERLADFAGPSSQGRKIFLARPTDHKSLRTFINEQEISEIAGDLGFEIIEPSTLSFQDQASLFAQSSMVAGEFNSALHNAIFSGPGTKVIAINWVNRYQWLIAEARGHYLDYVTPEGGNVLFGPEQGFHARAEDFVSAVRSAEGGAS